VKDALPWLGGILTAAAALLGAYAALKAKRIDDKTATRAETQQALDAQGLLLNRYEKRIGILEKQVDAIQDIADGAIAARNEMRLIHKECDRSLRHTMERLKIAEAKISELGG
jgi:hypothetical protein